MIRTRRENQRTRVVYIGKFGDRYAGIVSGQGRLWFSYCFIQDCRSHKHHGVRHKTMRDAITYVALVKTADDRKRGIA